MKNLLAFLAFLLLLGTAPSVHAQEKFTTYENSYAKKTYDIQLATKDKPTLYIDAYSLDPVHETGGIGVTDKQHEAFVQALTAARAKYAEWVAVAKANKVTDLEKEMPALSARTNAYFSYGSDWQFDFYVTLGFNFRVLDSGGTTKYLLIARTGELQSSSNQFIKVKGFALVFSSTEEIDAFLQAVAQDKINAFMAKPKAADLFKG